MNFSNSTTDKTERLEDTNDVNRLQSRIAKATVKGDKTKTQSLNAA